MPNYRRSGSNRTVIVRVLVLGVAISAGYGAFTMLNEKQPVPAPVVAVAPPSPVEDILVAATSLERGKPLAQADLKWRPWPKDATTPEMIRRSESPNAIEEMKGTMTRVTFFNQEPIRRDKLGVAENSSVMSEILKSGYRAVAISIDSQGSTTAGGFILPNDRVDVIRTFADTQEGSKGRFASETLLRNIRVLAIGQNVQQKNGESVIVGSTATLEANPEQAEKLILAQRLGQLSLTLRSLADARPEANPSAVPEVQLAVVTVVRNGARQDYKVPESELLRQAREVVPAPQKAQDLRLARIDDLGL